MVARGSDAAYETRMILGRIQSTLEAASLDFGAVEDVCVYLADVRDGEAVRAVLRETLGADHTEPTVVGNRLMGRSRVEIQIVAKR